MRIVTETKIANHLITILAGDGEPTLYTYVIEGPDIKYDHGFFAVNMCVLLQQAIRQVNTIHPEAKPVTIGDMPLFMQEADKAATLLERYASTTLDAGQHTMRVQFGVETLYVNHANFEMYLEPIGFEGEWL